MKIDIIYLGCSKNLVDSERLTKKLENIGHNVCFEPKKPAGDVVVINTCGFIESAKSEAIDFHLTKIENDRYNLQVQQKDIEAADLTQEITDLKSAEAAYNATLQMGSQVIPQSIFDFIR